MTSILKADTIQDTDGNNIINESGNTITIGASGDTITIPSGATIANSGTQTGFGLTKAVFNLYASGNQSISNNTQTVIEWSNAAIDTASGADFTNNRWTVPSGYAGNYYLSGQVFGDFTDTSGERGDPSIRINGTERIAARLRTGANGGSSTYLVSGIFNLNVGDHVQLYFYQDSGSSQNTDANQNYTWLVGTRLDDA